MTSPALKTPPYGLVTVLCFLASLYEATLGIPFKYCPVSAHLSLLTLLFKYCTDNLPPGVLNFLTIFDLVLYVCFLLYVTLAAIEYINYDINYQYSKNKFTTNIGVFLHDLNHIPSDNNYYSAINSFNILNLDNIFPNTSAISKGVYAHISKELNNGLWLNLNSTIFDLKYKSSNYDWQNAETNYGKIYNFNIGKKIKLRKGSMFISSSFHYRGGAFQYPPIFFNFTPTVDYSQPPLIRLGNYKRLDLRINYTKGKVFWSLDIQNALNTLNGAYQYFDIGGLRTQKQLGMIPVLTYKYSF